MTRGRRAGGGDGSTQEAPSTGNRVPGQSLHCSPQDTGRGTWLQGPIPRKEGPCDFGRLGGSWPSGPGLEDLGDHQETTEFHEVVPFSGINFSRNRAYIKKMYHMYLKERDSKACF